MNNKFLANVESQVATYYRGKSVFITGATGFLGKVLIEKLLRSCNEIKSIYVLVRSKKGKSPEERLNDIISSHQLFDLILEQKIEYKSKLIPVEGDLLEPDLGINERDRAELAQNVNIVFHSAATVRFDEPIRTAIRINVIGTYKVIQLSKTFKNLEVFVHISTAYANCNERRILEEVMQPPMTPERAVEAVDLLDDANFNKITKQIIHPRPNSYIFTKAIAESLVLKESTNIPCIIMRPSIVAASLKEPFPGWIDNFNGPTGLFQAFNMGILRCMVGNRKIYLDMVPVDMCINMLIVGAWYRGSRRHEQLIVYNCTMEKTNRCTWGMIEDFGNLCTMRYPPPPSNILTPGFKFTKYKSVRTIKCFFLQWIPAYALDMLLRMFNQKPFLVRLQRRLMNAMNMLEHFTVMELDMPTDNIKMLLEQLNEKDRELFEIDTRLLKWTEYMEDYNIGIKRFLVKEDYSASALQLRRRNYQRMRLAKNVLFYGSLAYMMKYSYAKALQWKWIN